ncbi:MAG: hypothetical protein JWO47_601 [Candidatus Saccharibacteria bacterium]|nr:hypothetical protein [Candidatus Saccharibacteria bacterium]
MLAVYVIGMVLALVATIAALLVATGKIAFRFASKETLPSQKKDMALRIVYLALFILVSWALWNFGSKLLYGK